MAHCMQCGADLRNNAKFCNKCGATVKQKRKKKSVRKTRTPAIAPVKHTSIKNTPPKQKRRAQNAQASRRAPPPRVARASKIPNKLLPLLRYILAETLKAFFKRLPMTIAIGLGAWVFHTYLLVYINEGFSPSAGVGKFLALQGQFFSGSLIWMIGSALLMGLLAKIFKRKSGISLKERITAIKRYLSEARMDAFSVLTGGVGIALLLTTFTNSTASLALAVGMGVQNVACQRIVMIRPKYGITAIPDMFSI